MRDEREKKIDKFGETVEDIYDMFNDIELDEDEFCEMPADDLERERVKRQVRARIAAQRENREDSAACETWRGRTLPETGNGLSGIGDQGSALGRKQKRIGRRRGAMAAAACMALILCVGGFGLAMPAYAREMPLVGDIFRYLDEGRTGRYDHYKESAVEIGITREAKGVSVTLEDGVFDGSTLYLTYSVRTDRDWGKRLWLDTDLEFPGGLGIQGWGGTKDIQAVKEQGEGVYVGMEAISFDRNSQEPLETLPFTWVVSGFEGMGGDGETVLREKCSLHFNVELSALSGNEEELSLSGREMVRGLEVSPKRLIRTDANTILIYGVQASVDTYDNARVSWEIADDLGNVYPAEALGGTARDQGNEKIGQEIIGFGAVDPKAKMLLLRPTAYYAGVDENGERIWNNDEGFGFGPEGFEIVLK